jgi:hypothetical protein
MRVMGPHTRPAMAPGVAHDLGASMYSGRGVVVFAMGGRETAVPFCVRAGECIVIGVWTRGECVQM